MKPSIAAATSHHNSNLDLMTKDHKFSLTYDELATFNKNIDSHVSQEQLRHENKLMRKQIDEMTKVQRQCWKVYNNCVSESSQVVDFHSGRSKTKVEIKAMASVIMRLSTVDHVGPIRFFIEFENRAQGDIECLIGREKDLTEDSCIWLFKDKKVMTVFPKQAFSMQHQTGKPIKNGCWQPSHLYLNIRSDSGCTFEICALFIQEEELNEKRQKRTTNTNDDKALSKNLIQKIKQKINELAEHKDGLKRA